MNNRLYSIQEAANILGVSTKTLRRWDQRGRFVPTRTAGNQRRYTQEQLQEFKSQKSRLRQGFGEASKISSTVKPLFTEEAPRKPQAVHSLPSMLSGLPSDSFLKQHFVSNYQTKINQQRELEELRASKEELARIKANSKKMSKFGTVGKGFMFAALVLVISFAGAI